MKKTASPISIDTNIVIRLCIYDDPLQSDLANNLFDSHSSIHISDLSLVESAFVLTKHYKLSRAQTCHTLRNLISQPNINCNKELFKQAFEAYENHPSLSLEDCCLTLYAQLNNAAPLFTFDKKLANQLPNTKLLR